MRVGSAFARCATTAALAVALSACGGDDEPTRAASTHGAGGGGAGGGGGGAGGCAPGEVAHEGGCCRAGSLLLDDGSCRPAGVAPDGCAAGFAPDAAAGCTAILPPSPCPKGQIAVPGDVACREVAPCNGAGPWGEIPVEPSTQYVDASYAANDGDGSAAKPWTTIQEGIDAAAPGAIVAVAAGAYGGITIQDKPVRVWGRCPTEVEIASPTLASVLVMQGAEGSELRDFAIAGGAFGLVVDGSEDVLADRLWIHDTGQPGVLLQTEIGPSGIEVSRSLIEATSQVGVFAKASKVVVEASAVRDTLPAASDKKFGQGIFVQDLGAGQRSDLTVRSSLVAHNTAGGVFVFGSDATIEGTLVADTQPRANDQAGGEGIVAQTHPGAPDAANVTVRSSVVERNREAGVFVYGSATTIESTVIRDTLPQASNLGFGRGINVQGDPAFEVRGSLTLRASTIDASHEVGVLIAGSDALVEGTIVRETKPSAADQRHGWGIEVQDQDVVGPADLTLRGSLVDRNTSSGVTVGGSKVILDATLVRDTFAEAAGGIYGRGVAIEVDVSNGVRSIGTVTACRIEGSTDVGLLVVDADVTVDRTAIVGTQPRPADGAFGDGIAVGSKTGAATAVVTSSLVSGNARAGISSFGAAVSLAGTVLECNAVQLDGEAWGTANATYDDLGGNRCGCDGTNEACTVLSSSLPAPEPAEPIDRP